MRQGSSGASGIHGDHPVGGLQSEPAAEAPRDPDGAAAVAAGGKDHGKPGPRKDYSPDYYASFILDPEGNNIEAVYYIRQRGVM